MLLEKQNYMRHRMWRPRLCPLGVGFKGAPGQKTLLKCGAQ